MPLSVPEKKEPQPSYEELAKQWLSLDNKDALVYALLAINDTLKQIGITLSWSRT